MSGGGARAGSLPERVLDLRHRLRYAATVRDHYKAALERIEMHGSDGAARIAREALESEPRRVVRE